MKSKKRVLMVCVMSGLFMAMLLLALLEGNLASAQTPNPGIAISPGYSIDVDPDSVVDYVHIITNTGNVDVQLDFQLTTSEGWPVNLFNAAYPGGTTVGLPLPLLAGETMTMGIRLTVPVTVSGGVINTTTLAVAVLFQGDRYGRVVVNDIAVVRRAELPYAIYLPLVMRAYAPPLTNGDFSEGLAGWRASGILGAAIALDPSNPSNPVARLGNPGYACWDGVPIGNGVIQQQFSAPPASDGKSIHLFFRYRIFTNDLNTAMDDTYDSFDVFVNDVLRFRDANQSDFDYCNVDPYDLGWKTGDIDLGAGGILANLSFEVHNRADQFYNTYVYIDDIRLVERD